jgi:hypothetical protein
MIGIGGADLQSTFGDMFAIPEFPAVHVSPPPLRY